MPLAHYLAGKMYQDHPRRGPKKQKQRKCTDNNVGKQAGSAGEPTECFSRVTDCRKPS
jgi:hypothetical protein